MFSFPRNCCTVLKRSWVILHSLQQCHISSFSMLPAVVLFAFVLSINHPSGHGVALHCGLICMSPVTSDVMHLFMSLMIISVSFKRCLFKPFPHFHSVCIFLLLCRHFIYSGCWSLITYSFFPLFYRLPAICW